MRRVFSAAGVLLQTIPGTQPHESGINCARDEQGVPLRGLAVPAVATPAAAPAEPPAPTAPPAADLLEVMREFDPTDVTCWTKSSKPRVESVEDRLGRQITVAERDAAWAVIQAEQSKEN